MSRARGARRPDGPLSAVRRGCSVWVMMLMYVTVGAKWSTDKIQFHGYSVIRFSTGGRGQPLLSQPETPASVA